MSEQSFYAKIRDFLNSYVNIPQDDYYYAPNGNLTKIGVKTCVNFLVRKGVFSGANDMKKQAFKDFNIILPDWVFENIKRSDNE